MRFAIFADMKKIFGILAAALMILLSAGCNPETHPNRDHKGDRKLLLYYGAGFNSLSSYLREDIGDLLGNAKIPSQAYNDDVLLIYEHLAEGASYKNEQKSCLYRVYRNRKGEVLRETLLEFDPSESAIDPEVFKKVVSYATVNFSCDSYGMIYSSHGFGYLPEGYYTNPSKYDGSSYFTSKPAATMSVSLAEAPVYGERLSLEVMNEIATKTIGQEFTNEGSVSIEMELSDFAAAFSRKFDYILLDACLMGGVEVAYELRNAARYIGFSQTEIMAEGLPYDVILDYLFADGKADPEGVCKLYIKRYKEGAQPWATFSLINTDPLDMLASVCRDIFSAHRTELMRIDASKVQGYFRYNRHFFYDLADMMSQLPLTSEEKALFESTLGKVVIYKDATDYFMTFSIKNHCGLSCMLPSNSTSYLNRYYKTTAWNKAVSVIE